MRNERKGQGSGARGQGEKRAAREAFTLVELLVVIVIIIILMGLLTPVLVQVMARAREARITVEIGTLDMSLKAYKERYGQYPPSDFSQANSPTGPVALHLAHCFPRCNVSASPSEVTNIPTTITPAQALVFWLSGFSPDPEHPITGTGTRTPFFPFDTPRLTLNGNPVQIGNNPPGIYAPADGLGAPYVYFAAQNYATQIGQTGSQGDYCMPYVLDNGPTVNPLNPYANPNSFQIISAGLDGSYGTTAKGHTVLCSFPSGKAPNPSTLYSSFNDGGLADQTAIQSGIQAYSQGDFDNLTNFSSGSLKDAMP